VLERLMAERYPIYAEADFTVPSSIGSAEETVDRIVAQLRLEPPDDPDGAPPDPSPSEPSP
jgi:hypothetical protein